MAGSVNKAILIGNLGQDPEVRYLESGQAVANFTMATNRAYSTREGERREETEWHRVVLWGKLAEIADKYLKKGNTIYVEGRLRTRQWQDKDGVQRYTTEIVGENMTMLGGPKSEGSSEQSSSRTSTPVSEEKQKQPTIPQSDGGDDDLPF